MKKKCGFHRIMAGAVVLVLMIQFSALAADKVVVIPLFSSGDKIPTVTSKTGRVWMDRNLGAFRVAGSKSDSLSYGWLYQWGRPADGHESRTSPTIHQKSAFDVPGHGDFITIDNINPYDWHSTPNNDLWATVSSSNNPCPPDFRLPTSQEWNAESATWMTQDAAGAYQSILKLTMAGNRSYTTGSISGEGDYGRYWAATTRLHNAYVINIYNDNIANNRLYGRAYGLSVRCIAE